MIKFIMHLFLALLISMTQLNAAPPGQVNDEVSTNFVSITYVTVDDGVLHIYGSGFPTKVLPIVKLESQDNELVVIDGWSEHLIKALIPDNLIAGEHLLVVTNNGPPVRVTSYMLTIGAVGPKGNIGDIGSMGPQGEKGDTGAMGLQGPKGDTGDEGPEGALGPAGPNKSNSLYKARHSVDDLNKHIQLSCNEDDMLLLYYGGSCPLFHLLHEKDVYVYPTFDKFIWIKQYTCRLLKSINGPFDYSYWYAMPEDPWGICQRR